MQIDKFFLLLGILTLTACGGGSGGGNNTANRVSNTNNCSLDAKKQFVYAQMQDTYLWYDQVPSINPLAYASPADVLEATRFEPLDRFSYTISVEEFNNFFLSGEYIGMGFSHNENGYIRYVFKQSPADNVNLQRGDRIMAVDDITVDEIIAQNLWDSIFGARQAGVEVNLQIQKAGSQDMLMLNLRKQTVIQNTVLHRSVLEHNGERIAYLVFNSFTELSYDELAQAFAFFAAENVDRMILDLRYNGGGFLDVARLLGSLIAGANVNGLVFYHLQHNDKHRNKDTRMTFSIEPNTLALDKLTVLTSEETCSASEAVINGLTPFIEVNTIGSTTCGKPVGMSNPSYCDLVLSHIEFQGVNATGFGDYFDGFMPTCPAVDDARHNFGDPQEAMLGSALHFVEHQTCSPTAAKIQTSQRQAKTIPHLPPNYRYLP